MTNNNKINWSRLKENRCPHDDTLLSGTPLSNSYGCTSCGFKIGKEKFDSIVNSLYKPRAKGYVAKDNSEELNNF